MTFFVYFYLDKNTYLIKVVLFFFKINLILKFHVFLLYLHHFPLPSAPMTLLHPLIPHLLIPDYYYILHKYNLLSPLNLACIFYVGS